MTHNIKSRTRPGNQEWPAGLDLVIQNDVFRILEFKGYHEPHISGGFLTSLPEILHLPVATLVELLDISKSKYYRLQNEDLLDLDTVDKLSSLMEIYRQGSRAFDGDGDDLQEWIETKNINLGDQRPLDLMKTERGRQQVSEALDRIEYGIYG